MPVLDSAVFSTAYLPPVGYFAILLKHEKIYFEKNESFLKQTYRNRCYIYGPNGKQPLIIPVKKSNNTKIYDVRIDYTSPWNNIHWKSIESAYNKSPFFMYYSDLFRPFYIKHFDFLFDFNQELIYLLIKMLKLKNEVFYTEEYFKEYEKADDYRYCITPKELETEALYQKEYSQVFSEKYGYITNLSVIDLLFNRGNLAKDYLLSC